MRVIMLALLALLGACSYVPQPALSRAAQQRSSSARIQTRPVMDAVLPRGRGRGGRGGRGGSFERRENSPSQRGAVMPTGRGRGSRGRGSGGPRETWDDGTPLDGPVPARVVTTLLTRSRDVRSLLSMYLVHGKTFNQVHISAFWTTLGKHARRHPRQKAFIQEQLRFNVTLFYEARQQTLSMLPELGGREVVNTAHGIASAGVGSEGEWLELWESLAASCAENLHTFNSQGLSNMVWAFATASYSAPPLFAAASVKILEQVDTFSPQGLANTAWAYATVGDEAPELFEGLSRLVPRRGVEDFKAQELCNLLWAYATSGTEAPEIFDVAASSIASSLDTFSPQGIANFLWSYATLGHDSPDLFTSTAEHAIGRLYQFNQQELSLTAWSYATLNESAPELFDALAKEASARVHELNPQAVSNMAWAFATQNHDAPELFEALAEQLVREREHFHPQGLAITTWALATVNHQASEQLQQAIVHESTRRIDEFNQQGLSNLAWAMCQIGTTPAPQLYDAIARQCLEVLDTFNQQGLANLLWAFAKQSQPADALFHAAIPTVVHAAEEMTTQSLVSIVWSYAVLGYAPPALFRPFATIAKKRLEELSPQGLSNLAWAFAVADVDGEEVDHLFEDGAFVERVAVVIGETGAYSSEGSTAFEHVRQLHQWELWREDRATSARRAGEGVVWPSLPEEFRMEVAETFARQVGRPSEFQRQVYKILEELGMEPEEEVTSSLGYSLDIVVKPTPEVCSVEVSSTSDENDDDNESVPHICSEQTKAGELTPVFPGDASPDLIAIEVDGPSHFLYKSVRPTGSTIIKRRQLQRAGWRLIPVPYFEWREATRHARTPEEVRIGRRRYMARQLGMELQE